MRASLFFILISVIISFPSILPADPVSQEASIEHEGVVGKVRVTASEREITISESITLKLEVTIPKGYTAQLPSMEEFGFSTDFSERSKRFRPTDVKEAEMTLLDDGSKHVVQEYTLEPWLSGNYSILPIMISFFREKKETASIADPEAGMNDLDIPSFNVMTDGFRIAVNPMPEGRKELSDLFGQSDYSLEKLVKRKRRKDDKSDEELKREEEDRKASAIALKQREFPWWIIWTLLSVMVLFPAYWFIGRKKIKELLDARKIPAHEIAYQEFLKLVRKNLLEQGKIKEFYYELSFILRKYIGNRFHIYAENQTTEEFFSALLVKNPFDHPTETILRKFSEHSDNVKYSLYRPGKETAEDSFKIAKSFVDTTKLTEEEAG